MSLLSVMEAESRQRSLLEQQQKDKSRLANPTMLDSLLNTIPEAADAIGNAASIIAGPTIEKAWKAYSNFNTENSLAFQEQYRQPDPTGQRAWLNPTLQKFKDPNTTEEEKTAIRQQVKERDISTDPILKSFNSDTGKAITGFVADKSSNIPLKGLALLQSIGDSTYEEAKAKLIESSENPYNPTWKRWLYGVQNSGVQSSVGVLLALGTTILSKSPMAGQAAAGAYFAANSAEGQRKDKGRVESVGDIAIDTIGDTMLSGVAESILKETAGKGFKTTLKNMGKGFTTEGGTEVIQSLATYGNDYANSTSDAERQKVVQDTVQYVKSGAMLDEFMIGGLSGAAITGTTGIFSPKEVNPNIIVDEKKNLNNETPPPAGPSGTDNFVLPEVKDNADKTVATINSQAPHITNLLGKALDNKITVEDISSLNDKEIRLLGIGLQAIKGSNPEHDQEAINSSLQKVIDTGIELPTVVKNSVSKIEKNPVEAPKPTQKPNIEQKPIEKPVNKVEEPQGITPLQEGGKNPLIEEAKKYKTEEEFIKAQGKQDYRSSHQLSLSDSVTADKIDVAKLKEQIRTRNGYLNKYNLSDLKKLEKLQNNPEAEVTIYRASPKNELNDGDWVTTDKTYANDIKKQNGGKVYSYTAKVKDLRFPNDTETLPSLSMGSSFSYSPKTSQLSNIYKEAHQPQEITPKVEAKEEKTQPKEKKEVKNEKQLEAKEKPLKLKYPESKEKLKPSELKNLGIILKRKQLADIMKMSPDFKSGSVLTMKDGMLRFEGKTHKFKIKPSALGLSEVKEGEKITVDAKDLKGNGQIPILARLRKSTEEVVKLLSEKSIQDTIDKMKKEINPEIARRAIFNITEEIVDIEDGKKLSAAGVFDKRSGLIEISQSQGEETMEEAVYHEPGHFAWTMLKPSEKSKALEYYENISLENKRSLFGKNAAGQWRYDLYEKDYGGDNESLAEEYFITRAAKEFLASKGQYSQNKIIAYFQKLMVEFTQLYNKVHRKIKGHDGMSVMEMFSEVYNPHSDFYKGRNAELGVPTQSRSLLMRSIIDEKTTEATKLVTEKGNIRVQEVFNKLWKDLYKTDAPKHINDMLFRPDSELFYKGSHISFTEGKKYERNKQVEKRIEYRIKQAKKNKELRAEIIKSFKEKSGTILSYKKQAIEYVKNLLPKNMAGYYLTAINNLKGGKGGSPPVGLGKILASVDKRRENYERKELVKSIEKILNKLHLLPVEAQRDILAIINQIEMRKHTNRFMDRIRSNKQLYDSISEDFKKNVTRKVLQELGILEKTPFTDVTTQQLMEINIKLQQISMIGHYDLKKKKESRQMSKEKKLAELKENSVNLDRVDPSEVLNIHDKRNLTKKGAALLKYKEVRDYLQGLNWREIGTDRFFQILDRGNDDLSGPNATIIYKPIIDSVNDAQDKIDRFRNVHDAALNDLRENLTRDLLGEEGMASEEINKIIASIQDARKTENGVNKFWNMHPKFLFKIMKKQKEFSEDLAVFGLSQEGTITEESLINGRKYRPDQIEELNAKFLESPYKKKFYDYVRKELDAMQPRLSEKFSEMNPTESLGKIENFWMHRTDYAVTSETTDADIERYASVNFASLKSRKKNAKQVLSLDGLKDFQNYIEASEYYISTADSVKNANEIINAPEYAEIVGEQAQKFLNKWLKITAKRGGKLRKPLWIERLADGFRTNIGPSYLGLRPSTMARQLTAWANGAAIIGESHMLAGTKMMTIAKMRSFMRENSVQMRNRMGGDVLWEDLSSQEIIKRLQELSMKGTALTDYGAAGATWMGAYIKKMQELGIEVDSHEYNKEAGNYADLMMRLSQGSAHFMHAPQVLFDENRTWWRTFHTFETFNLSNWSQISHDLPKTWQKDKKAGAKKAAWLMIQTAGNSAITMGNAAIIASLFGGDDEDKQYWEYLVGDTIGTIPFANKIYAAMSYGTVPIVAADFTSDLISAIRYSFIGVKDETRLKYRIKAVALVLEGTTGLPPAFLVDVITKMINK